MTPVTGVVEYPHGSPGYLELLRLRDLHLRQPLGLRLSAGDRADEESQRHFALEDDGVIIGGLIARPVGEATVKLRQMWVDPAHRGRGHGGNLLATVESLLVANGTRHFTLHARADAAGFYRRNGYVAVGDAFIEVGLPHLKMEKTRLARP